MRFADHLDCLERIFGVPVKDIRQDISALKYLKKITSQAINANQRQPLYETRTVRINDDDCPTIDNIQIARDNVWEFNFRLD